MKKLTKRHALELCRDMWAKLARSGADEKPETDFLNDCPCCEFVKSNRSKDDLRAQIDCGGEYLVGSSDIEHCPLKALWPDGCFHKASPYFRWSVSAGVLGSPEQLAARKRYAKVIADGARAELKKMDGK